MLISLQITIPVLLVTMHFVGRNTVKKSYQANFTECVMIRQSKKAKLYFLLEGNSIITEPKNKNDPMIFLY